MGKITVSDRAVAQIAEYAAKQCSGFAGMSDKTRAADVARRVSGNTSGVYITKTRSGVKLEMYIACKHGADTKLLTDEVAEAVAESFPCTGITIKDVIVHINDVR